MRNWSFLILGILIFICSCEQAQTDLRNYYLPFDLLEQSDLLMEYRYVGTQDAPFYWYYSMNSKDGEQVFFSAEQLDVYGEVLVETEELLVENGVVLRAQKIYERDTLNGQRFETSFDIMSDDLFQFKGLSLSSNIKSRVAFNSSLYENQKTTIDKERQYIGDTIVVFDGQNFPAKRFSIKELYDIEEIGHLEFELEGEEVYADGLGLVYVNKTADSGQAIEYYLHKYELVDDEK